LRPASCRLLQLPLHAAARPDGRAQPHQRRTAPRDGSRARIFLRGCRARAASRRLVRFRHLRAQPAVPGARRRRGRPALGADAVPASHDGPAHRILGKLPCRRADAHDHLPLPVRRSARRAPPRRAACWTDPSPAGPGRHRAAADPDGADPDREVGRLRRRCSRRRHRAARLPRAPWNDAPRPEKQDQSRPAIGRGKSTMLNLHRRKSQGFPLDRIMPPDTMAEIFGVTTF
jgi:hypothetical protein